MSTNTESSISEQSFPPATTLIVLVYRDSIYLSYRAGKDVLYFRNKSLLFNFYYSLFIHLVTMDFSFYSFLSYYFNNFDTFDILFSYISKATLISIYFLRSIKLLSTLTVCNLIVEPYPLWSLFLFLPILLIFFNLLS